MALIVVAAPASAEQSSAELARELNNPVAALISVPIQLNYDQKIGPAEGGERWSMNLQPVVPFELNAEWNLISRTILPIVSQSDIFPGAGRQSGLGDIVQSAFFSPRQHTASDWIWGAGPVLLLPTGTDALLSGRKWGAGPTAVLLKQESGWTYGALVNHLWSFAGDSQRQDISATFIQPVLSYTTADAWTYSVNTESTYDWEASQWSVPLNLAASKVTKIGGQLMSIGGGLRYWADGPQSGPHGLGFRFVVTLLFPQ